MADNGWKTTTIGSLIEAGIITAHKDGNYGSNYPRKNEFGDDGVPLLTAKLLDDGGRINFEAAPRLAFERAEKLTYGFIESGDVLLSHNATIGRVAVVPELREKILVGTSLTYYRVDSERLLPRYLAAFLAGRDFQNQLIAVMSHSTRNQVPITTQRLLSIVVPPLSEQKVIANILGTLDDKIELNRRMNETLEAMAMAIFKSWFVDFDPVRAKMDGRKPTGMDTATADLFPDSLEHHNGELKPTDWGSRALYDTAHFINGAAFRSEHFCDPSDALPVVKIAELKNGISGQTKFSNRSDLDPKYNIDTGTLLYSWSGSPDTSLDTFVWTLGPGLLNQHIFKVETDSEAQKHFVYYLLKCLRPTLIEIARNKQTTGLGHVTVADMRRLAICFPPDKVLEVFGQQVGPVFNRCFLNRLESQSLSTLRDTLLPKLLSGEIRFKEAEQLIEATT